MNERFDLGEGIARQELNVIFVIDNSGSMQGEKIGAVNNAIRDIMSIMPDIQDDTGDATIKISAMTFSDDAKWIYSESKTIEEFKWRDIGTEGATNLSAAYDELSRYLCKRESGGKMPDLGGVAPIIILMTDGMPTSYDWQKHLADLKKKGWFKVSLKVCQDFSSSYSDGERTLVTACDGHADRVHQAKSRQGLWHNAWWRYALRKSPHLCGAW